MSDTTKMRMLWISAEHVRQILSLCEVAIASAIEGYGAGSFEHRNAVELFDLVKKQSTSQPDIIEAFGHAAGR